MVQSPLSARIVAKRASIANFAAGARVPWASTAGGVGSDLDPGKTENEPYGREMKSQKEGGGGGKKTHLATRLNNAKLARRSGRHHGRPKEKATLFLHFADILPGGGKKKKKAAADRLLATGQRHMPLPLQSRNFIHHPPLPTGAPRASARLRAKRVRIAHPLTADRSPLWPLLGPCGSGDISRPHRSPSQTESRNASPKGPESRCPASPAGPRRCRRKSP